MSENGYWISGRNLNPIPSAAAAAYTFNAEAKSHSWASRTKALIKNEFSSLKISSSSRKSRKGTSSPPPLPRRRLVTISTSEGKLSWNGKWTCDYIFSLQELQLGDLAEDDQDQVQGQLRGNNTTQMVSITLCIQKHASFGLSVDGRIVTSMTRKCSICSSPYCRKIDTNFNVWVLPSTRHSRRTTTATQLPEIGGDDPSVIYVKPGSEADLDSLIQDTIRLATSVNETCSESCEKSEPTITTTTTSRMMQHLGGKDEVEQKKNAGSIDERWSRLLELRNSL